MTELKPFSLTRLSAGGIITNYYCTSACRHCLYGSSPAWDKNYLKTDMAQNLFSTLRKNKCRSVHIGGGEPMLNLPGLLEVLDEAGNAGISVEYVETNSSWYRNPDQAMDILEKLKRAGLSTLLVSISPFHNEYIPFKKIQGVLEACTRAGMGIFPWVRDFLPDIGAFNPEKRHSLEEYSRQFGSGYLASIPNRFWISMNGRAALTFSQVFELQPLEKILQSAQACRELTNTSHFHLDLFGNCITSLCSGLAFSHKDVPGTIQPDAYPLLCALYHGGVKALLSLAQSDFSFRPASAYLNKCHLCMVIRRHLFQRAAQKFRELAPGAFYERVFD